MALDVPSSDEGGFFVSAEPVKTFSRVSGGPSGPALTGSGLTNRIDARMRARCGLRFFTRDLPSNGRGDLPADSPEERRHLAGDRGDDDGCFFADGDKPSIAGA
jgi:hypothetical protein